MHRAAPESSSESTTATTPPRPPKRRRRWLRWLVGLVATVLVLLILIAVTVQIVLGTTLPKRLILGELQNAFGLRVEAQSMSVGWLGHTTLKNVTLSLPLAEHSLLDVPQMDVEHTNLPMIALTRGVK